jgi:hypothetical protein
MPSGSPSPAERALIAAANMTPAERSERARTAANARWKNEPDRLKATAPGRKAIMEHYEREVDPNHQLSAKERRKRAENARKEHLSRIRLKALRAARLQREEADRVHREEEESQSI